ncbi:MAG: hypothetical protein GKR91_05930 [Pseudomonadales bacterium]|nr:hypothetical protein [Pseudomonadales bacterium]
MPAIHSELTLLIIDWLNSNFDMGDMLVFVDDPILNSEKPPRIGSSIPDVYAKLLIENIEIIGEAKPGYDLTTSRTEKQLTDYISYIAKNKSTSLIVSTEQNTISVARKVLYPILLKAGVEPSRVVYLCP